MIARIGYALLAAWWLAIFGAFIVVSGWGLIEWTYIHVVVPFMLPFVLAYSWVTS